MSDDFGPTGIDPDWYDNGPGSEAWKRKREREREAVHEQIEQDRGGAVEQLQARIAELEAEVTTLKTQRDAFLDTLRHAWVAFQILSGDTFLTFFGSEDSREAAEAARKGMPAG